MILIVIIKEIINFFEKHKKELSFYGNRNTKILTFSSIDDLKSNSVTWVKKGYEYDKNKVLEKRNILIITDDKDLKLEKHRKVNVLICDDPRNQFFSILSEFFPKNKKSSYIANSAIVKSKHIHPSVYIGSNSYIDRNVIIGENTVINNNVTIESNVKIGGNCIIQSGVVLGSDGFGYYKNHKNKNTKIEHYGGIVIGNDVEIGSNTCIDKGTFSNTTIDNNVKIGNVCQVSHNVNIKENVLIASQSSISGSTLIKKNAYIAPGSTIRNKIIVGENSVIGLGSVVVKNVNDNVTVMGVPAREKLK